MISKPAIAIIIPGGIGTGRNNIGVPVLERIVKLLSVDFDITVFQLFPRNKDYRPENFDLVDVYSSNAALKFMKFFFLFRRRHREKKFQAVHGFWILPGGFLSIVMGKLFNIKSIVSVLGGDAIALPEIKYGQLRNSLYRKLIFWTLRNADEPNALTRYLVNNLKKAGFTGASLKVIPWGIDTKLFAFQEKQRKKTIQFLHIGNLHPVKDQDTLLRVFRMICDKVDAHLTLIGEGVLEAKIQALISELSLQSNVTVVKPVPYENLPMYYNQAEILLHTSLSEGQSEVVTEAMSCGLLVCGTKVGLMYDLPECCISVEVGDYDSLSHEILLILENEANILNIKNRARAWTGIHSIEWTAQQLREIYQVK